MPVQIQDTVASGGNGMSASGGVAARMLQSGFNINSLRTNGTLRKDEWIQYDTAVVEIARKNLIGVSDLLAAGLRYPVANALGVTRIEWETISDMEGADITMSGISESQNDRVTYDLAGMPLPIIHKDFNINVRALEASRKTGQALDTTQAQLASRKVAETLESVLFNGATVLGANNPIYGYRTALHRNTGNLTASWVTASGDDIVKDVLNMIDALVTDNMNGPYTIYVSAAVYVALGRDYKANSDRTILERVLAIPGISAVRPTKEIASDEVLMIQMTSDVVDMVDGLQPTTVEWESHAGFIVHFKVLCIMVPRIRNDQLNQSGIAHYTV